MVTVMTLRISLTLLLTAFTVSCSSADSSKSIQAEAAASDTTGYEELCATLDIPTCATTIGCRVEHGWPFDPDNVCYREKVALGCMAAIGCSNTMSYATGPDGTCYRFSTVDCLPESGDWDWYEHQTFEWCEGTDLDEEVPFATRAPIM